MFKTERRRGDGLKPAKKYPSTVADIVENAIMPDDVKVVYYEKDNFKEVDIDAQCKQAISLGKSYWKITLREGKDGIFWIRDEDQQIVCEYRAT